MDAKILKQLQDKEPTPFMQQMLEDTRALVSISRRKMTEYYPAWDKNDDIYRSIKQRDKADILANERNEPEKMVVPISFAQIQTFVAFCFLLYYQRDRFFELDGFTAEDDKPAKVGEALLARDLTKNVFEAKLVQYLLDIARFGIGILKVSWSVEKQMVRKEKPKVAPTFLGMKMGKDTVEEAVEWATAFEGNRITNISPYRFFPDVRLPLTRFQEGEFCASEDLYSVSQLKQWEHDGLIAGVDHIKPLGKDIAQDRGYRWDTGLDPGGALTQGAGIKGDGQTKKTVIITECQRTIIPSQYEVDGEPLGEEDYPIKYNIWIANDNRVIKCEPMNYLHNEFTFGVGQFIYDNNVLLSPGLSDVIDQLQNVISWFINSRITNVRKVIADKLIVNTAMVNVSDITNRRPMIRLTGAATGDIDRYIKQLQLQDVTIQHIADVKDLHDILKMVTGISDSLLGEVRPGHRSATENRNTTTGAASRMKTIAAVIFRSGLEPVGRQMLSNLRDGLDEETYVRLLESKAQATPEFIKVNKEDLVGHYDFEVFDGTLPSDRYHIAEAIDELLQALLSNPQAAMYLGMDPKKLLMESLQLRGVRNPERFALQQEPNANIIEPGTGAAVAGRPGAGAEGAAGAIPESLLPLLAGATGGGGNNGNGGGIPSVGTRQ
jgi:hypothetical protein